MQLIYKTLQKMVWSSKSKDPTYILTTTSSDPSQPVGPVHPTGRHHSAASTGQTGPRKNREAEHSALECTTRQSPNLRVSLHHLPPLCIPADELDTAGAEVDVRVPWNNNCGNKPWVY